MIHFIKIKKFILDNIIYRKYQIKYLDHLDKVFKKEHKRKHKNLILLELYPSWISIISFVYLTFLLSKKYNAKTILYLAVRPNKFKIFYYNFLKKFNISYLKIQSFYSMENLLIPDLDDKIRYKNYFAKIKNIKNKSDILKIKFEGILIGDLIYDGYLKKYETYTININSEEFREYFIYFCKLFSFWFEYIKKNNVKSVIASHPVYENAIPLRISYCSGNKYTFSSSIHFTYRHSKKYPSIEYDVKNRFNKLSSLDKKKALISSAEQLSKKFKGAKTMDTLLGERKPITQKIKKENNYLLKNNILIAIHSFSDAPHVFGNTIFSDHYEWLKFLANESKKIKKFNWLLKVHPIFYDKEISIVKNILKEYPHIKILPKSATNEELINKGVKYVLSVYGSVTYEYAYFGIPSILATKNHPYKKYNFLKEAGNKNEYKKLLRNLHKLSFNFSKNEILEYYFIRFVRVNRLFRNYYKIVEALGPEYTSPLIYKFWLKEFSEKKNNKIIKKLNSYLNSNNYRFEYYN